MKKTLVALAVAAFATSASAVTIYDNDGSKVDFNGSIRLLLEKNSSKTDGNTTKRAHSNLKNDGSRFGVTVKHNLAEDFYAFGRLEFRFNGTSTKVGSDSTTVVAANTTDAFGSLYAHRAYVGLGSKQYGEVSFGRQVTIGDDIAQSAFDNQYGNWSTTLTSSGKSVVRYDYKGIEGLQIGVNYNFAEERDKYNEVAEDAKKSGYGAGVVYGFKVAEGQSVKLAAGYTRDNYKVEGSEKHHKDAWAAGASYKINTLTLAVDYAGSFEKEGDTKARSNGFRVGAKYEVTPAVAVYGNYGYAVAKAKESGNTTGKTKYNGFILGASYQLHKNVFTYVEGGFLRTKAYAYSDTATAVSKKTDKNIGVGLRVSF